MIPSPPPPIDGWRADLVLFLISLPAFVVGVVVGIVLALLLGGAARAQESSAPWAYPHGELGKSRAEWFRSLKQPGTGISCCDESDCKRTRADWTGTGWIALAPDGTVVDIPPDKIIHDKQHPAGSAVMCWLPGSRTVLCFVPPAAGG